VILITLRPPRFWQHPQRRADVFLHYWPQSSTASATCKSGCSCGRGRQPQYSLRHLSTVDYARPRSGASLGGCTVAPQPAPRAPEVADPPTNITRKLENQWNQCLELSYQHWLLKQSYRTARKRTPDKNAAVEMAFQACASEEQDLDYSFIQTEPHAPSAMPHLKAETKRLRSKNVICRSIRNSKAAHLMTRDEAGASPPTSPSYRSCCTNLAYRGFRIPSGRYSRIC